MIRLVYSNRTEELLAELAAQARAQQARDGSLVPVRIVVPSAGVEGYVRLGVARASGIAANLEVALLTRFAADIVSAASGARVADAAALAGMALALLLDDAFLSEPELAPVHAYLRGAGDADDGPGRGRNLLSDAMDTRRVQLAARIGRLFEEYTYSRGDMLVAWRRDTTLMAETERWQRRMWLGMFGEEGLARRPSSTAAPRVVPLLRLLPLHEAVAAMQPAGEALSGTVHVFGFAHV